MAHWQKSSLWAPLTPLLEIFAEIFWGLGLLADLKNKNPLSKTVFVWSAVGLDDQQDRGIHVVDTVSPDRTDPITAPRRTRR